MTFIYRVTYYPLDFHGMRYTRKTRTGYVHAHSLEEARVKAEAKFEDVEDVF